MAKRLAELGALQDAVSNDESSPKRLALAGYIRGLFLDWSANPYNPLSRLTARGRLLGYFWDSGAIGLSMNFADQNYLVKDGTVQSKSFSQIVNFSRTTNATVTNSDGLITYAPHNLLLASEQFDNAAWAKQRANISSNVLSAPNGTITADKFILDTTAATTHLFATAITQIAATYTFSIYAKAAELSQIYLNNGATSTGAFFNLSTGIATPDSGITATIESVGNGWYRCAITYLSTATSISNRCYLAQAGSTTFATADGVSGVYVWGAQLEIGSTATTYNSTTVKNLLGYSELFDNAAWTKSNSFVQTNLLTYSEAFDNAAWVKGTGGVGSAPVVTANSVIAPNGYQTADTVVLDLNGGTTSADLSWLYQNYSVTTGLVYTFSIYVKATTANDIGKQVRAGGIAYTDIVTLTSTWQRVTITATALSTGTVSFGFRLRGNEITNDVSIDIWGAQLVQGSVAGDYRRTDAAALPVYYPNHNGVVCAEKLVENTANNFHYIISPSSSVVVGTTYTESIYLKYAGKQYVLVRFWATGATQYYIVKVDLLTGTVVGSPSISGTTNNSYSITPVGDGWYRISLTCAFTSGATGADLRVFFEDNSGNASYTGDGTSGIYIFGAQVSDSASLDPYVLNAGAAPTAAAYYGARFDYDPVTLAPKGLLIEEQRSNLCVYSGTTSDVNWAASSAAKTSTNNLAPDASLTALLATSGGASAQHFISAGSVTFVSGTTYTLSAFVKTGTNTLVQLTGTGAGFGTSQYANYSLSGAGSVTASSGGTASIQQYPNGWYRVIFSVAATASINTLGLLLVFIDSGTDVRVPTNTNSGSLYMWGAQVEAGAFATSYIPTAASQVTRAADVATIQGSNFYSWYNQNEGSVVTDAISLPSVASFRVISANNNTTTSNITIRNTTTVGLSGQIAADGIDYVSFGAGDISNINYKKGLAYKINNAAYSSNGSISTDSSVLLPMPNQFQIGSVTTAYGNGTIKSISYYPQRLSNDVLKGLTA